MIPFAKHNDHDPSSQSRLSNAADGNGHGVDGDNSVGENASLGDAGISKAYLLAAPDTGSVWDVPDTPRG